MEFKNGFGAHSEAALGQYRLYFMDSVVEDRRISSLFEFEAGSDADAIELAQSLREGRPTELWRGATRLKSWDERPHR